MRSIPYLGKTKISTVNVQGKNYSFKCRKFHFYIFVVERLASYLTTPDKFYFCLLRQVLFWSVAKVALKFTILLLWTPEML